MYVGISGYLNSGTEDFRYFKTRVFVNSCRPRSIYSVKMNLAAKQCSILQVSEICPHINKTLNE